MITSNYQVDGDIFSYAYKFWCNSSDEKPSNADAKDGLINGAVLEEVDTGKEYVFDKSQDTWTEKPRAEAGDITVESKSFTENGTYTAPEGKAYSPVTVDVPNSYAAADEGKVVSNGELVAQSSGSVAENGTVDTTLINSLVVDVPNSYVAGDEGKVVSNGELVAQTSETVTANDTYDTTLINSLTVNVSGGGNTLDSHFLIIKKETITVGENSVTNGMNCVSYLMGMLSDPGEYFVFMSQHEKASYVNNEWAMCLSPRGNGGTGYRFGNGGSVQTMNWGSAYNVVLVPGSLIDVYTYSELNL